jgi:hypothetical protein
MNAMKSWGSQLSWKRSFMRTGGTLSGKQHAPIPHSQCDEDTPLSATPSLTTSYSDAKGKLLALKRFSAYLAQVPPGITPEVIDRPSSSHTFSQGSGTVIAGTEESICANDAQTN